MGSADDISGSRIALITPKTLVKKVKNALEAHGSLDKSVKIRLARLEEQKAQLEGASIEPQRDAFFIPTKLSVAEERDILSEKWSLLRSLGLIEYEIDIGVIEYEQDFGNGGALGSKKGCEGGPSFQAFPSETSSVNPLIRTICYWLHQLPHDECQRSSIRNAVLSYSWTYMIYPPLLLLPPTALSNLSSVFDSNDQRLPDDLSSLWYHLSIDFKISHIALNAPILATASKEASAEGGGLPQENILRSPTGLVPLYGDFGPDLPLDHVPTVTDLSSAFWCTAQQNGIFQTWAPRYTMFSRGNITEKARLLSLDTLQGKRLASQPKETSAVDLYAGIGYFAFSYAKAGVGKVLCWEINPWSTEGLRRGAKRNRWDVEIIKYGQAFREATSKNQTRLIVFQESNEYAAGRIAAIKDSIPPVRHVNCGLLPSSMESWEVAVQALHHTGGWIHAHENIAERDIRVRTNEIVSIFKQLVAKHTVHKPEEQRSVECHHVERVKSYAPGVMHYVLDISISPTG